MRNDDQKTSLILSVCGILPVVWLALLTAPYVSGGLVEIIRGLPVAMGNPFEIMVCEDSVKTVLIFLLAYAMGIGVYFSTRRNYRRREERPYRVGREKAPQESEYFSLRRFWCGKNEVFLQAKCYAVQHIFCNTRPKGRNRP